MVMGEELIGVTTAENVVSAPQNGASTGRTLVTRTRWPWRH
jgi:hypothetical protein